LDADYTKENAPKLRGVIKRLEMELEVAKSRLSKIESECNHDWGETSYTPEYKKAYTIPGDPPGTMGVDWRGPVHVPAETIKKWTRICKRCGKKDVTDRIKKREADEPAW